MDAFEYHYIPPITSPLKSVCGYLGSFDPPHKGHEWLVDSLLCRFDLVVMMVPARHFEKTIHSPRNATLGQRLTMLKLLAKRKKNRIITALAHEVLFLRLADALAERFPGAEISFGMGNDTFEKVLDSQSYYERSGLQWTDGDRKKLDRLARNIVVFGRSQQEASHKLVPHIIRQLSSTLVRQTVRELRRSSAEQGVWHRRLKDMIAADVRRYLFEQGLYAV